MRAASKLRLPRLRWSTARPGRRDDDIDPAAQAAQLLADRLAAVDRDHAGTERLAVDVERLGDLHRQLAGRDDDEGARAVGAGRADRDALEDRQGEGRGLAGAGRRLGEDVAAVEQQRDRLALDRRRLLVAEVGDGGEQPVVQTEVGEAVGGGLFGGRAGVGRRRVGRRVLGGGGVGGDGVAGHAPSHRCGATFGARPLAVEALGWRASVERPWAGRLWHRSHCGRIPVRVGPGGS